MSTITSIELHDDIQLKLTSEYASVSVKMYAIRSGERLTIRRSEPNTSIPMNGLFTMGLGNVTINGNVGSFVGTQCTINNGITIEGGTPQDQIEILREISNIRENNAPKKLDDLDDLQFSLDRITCHGNSECHVDTSKVFKKSIVVKCYDNGKIIFTKDEFKFQKLDISTNGSGSKVSMENINVMDLDLTHKNNSEIIFSNLTYFTLKTRRIDAKKKLCKSATFT
jgi:hypothetical protein